MSQLNLDDFNIDDLLIDNRTSNVQKSPAQPPVALRRPTFTQQSSYVDDIKALEGEDEQTVDEVKFGRRATKPDTNTASNLLSQDEKPMTQGYQVSQEDVSLSLQRPKTRRKDSVGEQQSTQTKLTSAPKSVDVWISDELEQSQLASSSQQEFRKTQTVDTAQIVSSQKESQREMKEDLSSFASSIESQISNQANEVVEKLALEIQTNQKLTVESIKSSLVEELQYSGEAYKEQTVEELCTFVKTLVDQAVSRPLGQLQHLLQEQTLNQETVVAQQLYKVLEKQQDELQKHFDIQGEDFKQLTDRLQAQMNSLDLQRSQLTSQFDERQSRHQIKVERSERLQEQREQQYRKDVEKQRQLMEETVAEVAAERQSWLIEKQSIQNEITQHQQYCNTLQHEITNLKLQVEKETLQLNRLRDQSKQHELRQKQLDEREHDVEQMYRGTLRMKEEVSQMATDVEIMRSEAQQMKQLALNDKMALDAERSKFNQMRLQFAKQQNNDSQLLQENSAPWMSNMRSKQDWPWKQPFAAHKTSADIETQMSQATKEQQLFLKSIQ